MSIIKLTDKNFAKQVVQYGFFAEQIPSCFSSKKFAEKIDTLLPLVNIGKNQIKYTTKNITAPTTISTYKNDISRRILSVPNPEAFLRVVKFYHNNWIKIKLLAESNNSLSPVTYMRSYNDDLIEEINCENIREEHRAKSDFIDGLKECIRVSLGYQYRLKVDIANCYNSIYTHSVTWAICGKENAKNYMRTGLPADIKEKYDIGNSIDTFTRFQKNNETNGIVVGPYTSRVFSELILCSIDKILKEKGFIFKRYVDDYKFYFRTEEDANESVRVIEKVLNQYNLNLNLSKTEVQRFPYDNISSMNSEYNAALKKEGVFGVLNAAAQFHSNGEKGAYKYALKYIRKQKLEIKDFDLVFPLLVNIMLIDPKYGKYVLVFLKKNRLQIDIDKLTEIANHELKESLKHELQQESLLFLNIIHDLNLKLLSENLINILNSDDDFSIILALDIWKHHNSLVERTREEAKRINKAIKKLADSLTGENYSGSRWLLLYESEKHSLFPKGIYAPIEKNDFFKALYDNDVTFYDA